MAQVIILQPLAKRAWPIHPDKDGLGGCTISIHRDVVGCPVKAAIHLNDAAGRTVRRNCLPRSAGQVAQRFAAKALLYFSPQDATLGRDSVRHCGLMPIEGLVDKRLTCLSAWY